MIGRAVVQYPIGSRVKRNPAHFHNANEGERKALALRGTITAISQRGSEYWHIVEWDGCDYTGWMKPQGYYADELLLAAQGEAQA